MTGTSDLPAPLVPAEVDLRGFAFMPLDTARLLDSDLFALSSGDEFKAAVALWCKAWAQVPAASLPNDPKVLAFLSGAGPRWRKVKDVAMRGFILCSDNRWYHPVIARKALEAWQRREEWQEVQDNKLTRQQRWRKRLKEVSQRLRELGVTPPVRAKLETLERLLRDAEASTSASTHPSTTASTQASRRDASETALTGTGTGTGTLKPIPTTSGAAAPPAAPPPDPIFGFCLALLKAKGCDESGARSFLGLMRKQHGDALVLEACEAAKREDVSDPIPWIRKACDARKAAGAKPKRSQEPDFATLNYREGVSDDGRF